MTEILMENPIALLFSIMIYASICIVPIILFVSLIRGGAKLTINEDEEFDKSFRPEDMSDVAIDQAMENYYKRN